MNARSLANSDSIPQFRRFAPRSTSLRTNINPLKGGTKRETTEDSHPRHRVSIAAVSRNMTNRESGAASVSARTKSLEEVLKSLRSRESEMARLLGRFVRAESPSDNKPALDRFARMLAGEWRSRGARVQAIRQSHAGNLVRIEWSPSCAPRNSAILLLGHFDTVYEIGTLARMPFRISGGRALRPRRI